MLIFKVPINNLIKRPFSVKQKLNFNGDIVKVFKEFFIAET